jgi:hypothetical protein
LSGKSSPAALGKKPEIRMRDVAMDTLNDEKNAAIVT